MIGGEAAVGIALRCAPGEPSTAAFAPLSWLVDADIKGFFDNIDHAWMLRMLEERIDDRAFTRLIGKWLKAGVLEDIHTAEFRAGHPEIGWRMIIGQRNILAHDYG